MATIHDVARRAEVSLATVSRVVNKPGIVTPKTRERVLDAIQELNYRTGAVAQNRTFTAGIVMDISASHNWAMFRGLEQELRRQRITAVLCSSDGTAEGERRAIRFLLERGCNAAICHLEFMPDAEIVQYCNETGPLVLMNRHIPALDKNCVHPDETQGGALAARTLFERGHRRIATITGLSSHPCLKNRLTGFRDELARLGAPLAGKFIFHGTLSRESGYRLASQVFDRLGEATAVFCHSDEIALGILEAARQLDVAVPGHISVLGYGDRDYAGDITPKLTTIHQPFADIGRASGILAKALLHKEDVRNIVRTFAPGLVERESAAFL